ncbi:PSD1 and planctomycete cytochrome C domain-containing protein [Planctomyces sp. SH-PL14]|uniref:PSD1 and planctomycete cytochrome C domain-containing protein n=1 Tax=Planctomyces sp. SH-PL14 TaxID=1632864 RepID=UPI00078C6614|nr:PSD1 and planctomycete cytochrome C domain-containing protein [Planctomyces sp. SH-PL14]AMV22703.1 Planctomycete cytochrome C [Planctomyces sp. SH-PL14]
MLAGRSMLQPVLLLAVVASAAAFWPTAATAEDRVRFNRDIRQLLSDNCFACHGPDANTREADLRLDARENAVEGGAIRPGNASESEVIRRITSSDPDLVMPPPKSHKTLTPQQKSLLTRWIAEGAEYEGHWAYLPPVKAEVPAGASAIDHLMEKHWKERGLEPVDRADRRTLVRRLTFDLIGLPPTADEVDQFVADERPDAYDRLVSRLLASPHYGERMAIAWLDVVRFADTIGYHSDTPRNVYPYRDYVIRAFNGNKPFDHFTVEQLAGDLLPESTQEQKVASAFNRLLLTTEEGGAQAKDYEARMLGDRVRAVGTVWLGQTLGCCQCHDHKFDPIATRDFYTMGAFFADIQEPIIGRREAGMNVPTEDQSRKLADLQQQVAAVQTDFDGPHPELAEAFAKWQAEQLARLAAAGAWQTVKPTKVSGTGKVKLQAADDGSVLASGANPDTTNYTFEAAIDQKGMLGLRLEALPDDSLPSKGPGRAGNGNFVVTEVTAVLRKADGQTAPLRFASAIASFEQMVAGDKHPDGRWSAASTIDGDARDPKAGWAVLPEVGKPQQLLLALAEPVDLAAAEPLVVEIRQQHGNGKHTLGKFRLSVTASADDLKMAPAPAPPREVVDLLKVPAEQRNADQTRQLFGHFKAASEELAPLRQRLDDARKAVTRFEESLPKCLISVSMPSPRTVRILPRGDWQNDSGEIVAPALPGFLTKAQPAGDRRLNRLDLARWIVSPENPLTARVFANRLWKQFFGTGLSRNTDDLGSQGEWPTHPELLDWLAVEFRESGWNVQHLVQLIVSSRAYQLSSVPTADLVARDPLNRELARQNRYRFDAELVRDNALAIAGLLDGRIGGPSVKPYQPAGYWENLNFPVRDYDASGGADQYRRGLYTWWQRSFLHPSLLAFDAPTREECCADRTRSNIPQQALVLLNDPTYVECARALAVRTLAAKDQTPEQRIQWLWRTALQRTPTTAEADALRTLYGKHLEEFQKDPSRSAALLAVGNARPPEGIDAAELAAWTSAARVVLNLHEVITRN